MKVSAPHTANSPFKREILTRARDLVLQFGWNSASYQILQPRLKFWFAPAGDAVVGYVRRHGVRVVVGAPVCAVERLSAVVAQWEASARRDGDAVCYFGAGHRLEQMLENQSGGASCYAKVLLGAQPVWQPAQWPQKVQRHASLRSQIQRARNKKVQIEHLAPERHSPFRAHENLRVPSEDLIRQLRGVLQVWLSGRGLPALHFLVEPQLLPRLEDRHLFVARRDNCVVAYLVLTPVPARNGWLVEQIARLPTAPNGTTELLIDSAMRAAAQSGCDYFTLGLTPLWQPDGWMEANEHPRWLRLVLRWMRAHGRRFYNFDGLRAFKTKLHPQSWEPIYAISNQRNFSPRTLLAIIAAFSDQPPLRFAISIVTRAAREEWKRWRAR